MVVHLNFGFLYNLHQPVLVFLPAPVLGRGLADSVSLKVFILSDWQNTAVLIANQLHRVFILNHLESGVQFLSWVLMDNTGSDFRLRV